MRRVYRWVGKFESSIYCERLLPIISHSFAIPFEPFQLSCSWQDFTKGWSMTELHSFSLSQTSRTEYHSLVFWGNISHETFLSSSRFCPVFIGLFLFNHSLPFASYYVIASGRLCGFLGRDETGFFFCLKAYLRENALVRYSFYMCRTRSFLHKAFEILDLRCALMVALSLLSMLGIGLNTNIKTCVKSVLYLCPYCAFLQLPYPFCPFNAKISFHCLWNILPHSHISGYRLVGCYMLLVCGPGLMGYCNTSTLKLIKP